MEDVKMSKFTKDEQTEIVRWAMKLEAAVQAEETEIRRLESSSFPKTRPVEPSREATPEVQPVYPVIPKPQYPFGTFLKGSRWFWPLIGLAGAGFLLSLISTFTNFVLYVLGTLLSLGAVAVLVYSLVQWKKAFNQKWTDLQNEPENVKAREEAEAKAREEYIELDARIQSDYETAKRKYEEDLPEWQKEKALWDNKNSKKIAVLKTDLKENQTALSNLYSETGIISKNNRDLEKLVWLYEDMSTSEHDIERATDLLNANLQLLATKNTTSSIQALNADVRTGFLAVYDAIEEGNAKQDEMIDILRRTRRDMNLGNLGAMIQRNKTNKKLEDISEMLNKANHR